MRECWEPSLPLTSSRECLTSPCRYAHTPSLEQIGQLVGNFKALETRFVWGVKYLTRSREMAGSIEAIKHEVATVRTFQGQLIPDNNKQN